MKIRPATPADAAAIAALHASSWRIAYKGTLSDAYLENDAPADRSDLWAQRFAAPETTQCILVAQDQGRVAGFVCAYAGKHPQWGSFIDNLHVAQDQQGKGLGKALLAAIAGWCEQHAPGRSIYLSVIQSNHKAQGFYTALGARNAETGLWHAPDGSAVPTFWFVWDAAAGLAANASFERTSIL
jgi:ribosomal protein S18 acetylase RimI-like enzyme